MILEHVFGHITLKRGGRTRLDRDLARGVMAQAGLYGAGWN